MNLAFEFTVEDLKNIFNKHKVSISNERLEEIFDYELCHSEITEAALSENDFDKQVEVAFKEVEAQLKNNGEL